jgi:Recombination endonuclease VII
MRHLITNFSRAKKTGDCSVCGPGTRVYISTDDHVRCAQVQKSYWAERNAGTRYKRSKVDYRYQKLFGLTLGEYEQLVEDQAGVCLRCQRRPEEVGKVNRRLAIDHDHGTGLVRGLLCSDCNTYLGRLETNWKGLVFDLLYLGVLDREEDRPVLSGLLEKINVATS